MSKIEHTHCCYCRRKFSEDVELLTRTKDHFYPISRTGKNSQENKLQCCLECNRWKADKTPADWLRIVESVRDHKIKRGTYTKLDYAQIIGSLRHFINDKKGKIISDYKN